MSLRRGSEGKVDRDRGRGGSTVARGLIDPRDFCSHPIPGFDLDEMFGPLGQPEQPRPGRHPGVGDGLERVLKYRGPRA